MMPAACEGWLSRCFNWQGMPLETARTSVNNSGIHSCIATALSNALHQFALLAILLQI